MIEVINHKSSLIEKTEFNKETGVLKVKFTSGASYKYQILNQSDYDNFINSESRGKGFNQHIKPIGGVKIIEEND